MDAMLTRDLVLMLAAAMLAGACATVALYLALKPTPRYRVEGPTPHNTYRVIDQHSGEEVVEFMEEPAPELPPVRKEPLT